MAISIQFKITTSIMKRSKYGWLTILAHKLSAFLSAKKMLKAHPYISLPFLTFQKHFLPKKLLAKFLLGHHTIHCVHLNRLNGELRTHASWYCTRNAEALSCKFSLFGRHPYSTFISGSNVAIAQNLAHFNPFQ